MTRSRLLRLLRPLLGAFFLALAGLTSGHAAEIAASTGVGVSIGGNTGTVTPLSELIERGRSPLTDHMNKPARFDSWNNAAGAWPEGSANTKLPIPGSTATANGQVKVPVSRPSVGGALARFGRKAVPGVATAVALAELFQELGLIWEPDGEGGGKVSQEQVGGDCNYAANPSFANPSQFCANNLKTGGTILFIGYSGSYCQARIVCDGGLQSSITNIPRLAGGSPKVELTEQELADKIASKSGWPSGSKIGPAIAEALRAGEKIETEPGSKPKVSGPPQVVGQPKVNEKTNPDGSKEVKTSTTTHNITYNNNEYNVTNVTTTVTNIYNPDGTPKETIEEEATEEPEEAEAPSDPAMPEQPKLYEPKYPDGPAGVWNAEVAKIKATPLFQLPAQLAPDLGDSGGCPNWTIPLDVGIATFGTHGTNIPCSVWAFLRICILVGALFLARALIFGG